MSDARLRVAPPPRSIAAPSSRRPSLVERLARRLVLRDLRSLEGGLLEVVEHRPGGEQTLRLGKPAADDLVARLDVRDPAFWARVAFGGSIGAAEAFVEDLWTSAEPTAVVRLIARNPAINNDLEAGFAAWVQRTYRKWHDARDNSKEGSRTNIAAHYDLGNDFFGRFLDSTMMYSCGVFAEPDATLHEAQVAKLDLICRKLGLGPDHEVVEIGTGWGGFAIHAARTTGCRVWTTTISPAQHAEAERRIRAEGLEDRITLLASDYRDLPAELGRGRFDRLVSIEMIEAVGDAYLDVYLQTCAELLRPDGLALIQGIVMAESQYDTYRTGTDFIQRYIFPGSFLPSVQDLRARASHTSLRLAQLDDLTPHYPPTLRAWGVAVAEHADELLREGYSADFLRLWQFYLAYCEGGFMERATGDVHLLFAQPDAALSDRLPRAPVFDDGRPSFVSLGGGTPPLGSRGPERNSTHEGAP
jgi:cyclopropane-fatty-acyl-phospholipid synthase